MRLKNCNADQFIKRLNGKRVICFGAGSTLMEADYEVKKIDGLESHIAFFVDNDENKHGLKYQYKGWTYDIKNVEALKAIDVNQYVLLITCAFYVEIYRQLKDAEEIKELDCYMYNVVCSYPDLNVESFFTEEIEKYPYKCWKKVLSDLQLKDKHKGERCFIIGNGPSLTAADLEKLRGEVTFAANRIFKIFEKTDWRPTYYVCIDYFVYGVDHAKINDIDSKIKFVPLERALAAGKVYKEITYYNRYVSCVNIQRGNIVRSKQFDFSDNVEEIVYGGETVLYDAMQMAVYMGFSQIYFIGVDFEFGIEMLEDGTIVQRDIACNHFDKSYDDELLEHQAPVALMWRAQKAFEKGREECEKRGIVVKNATRGGKLDVFERISLEEILETDDAVIE